MKKTPDSELHVCHSLKSGYPSAISFDAGGIRQQAVETNQPDRGQRVRRSRQHAFRPLVLALACAVILASGLAALKITQAVAQSVERRTTLLGIGNCPPWLPQSVEVCRNSIDTVIGAFTERLALPPAAVRRMLNEGASASSLKKTVQELANTLGPEDRLIIYANLPSAGLGPTGTGEPPRQILQLWADHEPDSPKVAIETGTWVSAPAFAAMLHTVPAGEVVLILDTSNSDTIDAGLLEKHAANLDARPEALVTSAGAGQKANYSADRSIALFAKHLAAALREAEGTLADAIILAASGTRQAAIPICVSLKESQPAALDGGKACTQVPEIYDPAGVLAAYTLPPLMAPESN